MMNTRIYCLEALMERLNIESLFTFDAEFKGLVNIIYG
jgi:predicted nucleic acid-binding protein